MLGRLVAGVFDKRDHRYGYPSPLLTPPPRCAPEATRTLFDLLHYAKLTTAGWPADGSGRTSAKHLSTSHARYLRPRIEALPQHRWAPELVGSGPWEWASHRYFFLRGGFVITPWAARGGAALWCSRVDTRNPTTPR